jgi:hypothetical protein
LIHFEDGDQGWHLLEEEAKQGHLKWEDEEGDNEDGDAADDDEEEGEEEDGTVCSRCEQGYSFEGNELLLCEGEESPGVCCPHAFHLRCLRPPLMGVPKGEWLCPTCRKKKEVDKAAKRHANKAAAAATAAAASGSKAAQGEPQAADDDDEEEGGDEPVEVVEEAAGLRLFLSKKNSNPTGYVGVTRRRGTSFQAYVMVPSEKKQQNLGFFGTAVEAAVAYAMHMKRLGKVAPPAKDSVEAAEEEEASAAEGGKKRRLSDPDAGSVRRSKRSHTDAS